MSPERLWRLSAALRRRGTGGLVRLLVKKVQLGDLPHLARAGRDPSARTSSSAITVSARVHPQQRRDRKRVKIWHNVTDRPVRGQTGSPHAIIIEDDRQDRGELGDHHAPSEASLRNRSAGRGSSAGAVVVHDVPAGATVVGPPARVLSRPNRPPARRRGRGGRAGRRRSRRPSARPIRSEARRARPSTRRGRDARASAGTRA